MHKIVLCASLLFNSINFNNHNETICVKKIEYRENNNEFISLEVELYSSEEDILQMQVYFCDKEKVCQKEYYSSTLIIKGNKKTIAKVPFTIEKDGYLNIKFYSNNLSDYFEDVMFPIYYNDNQICYLSEAYECVSKKPGVIKYVNKVIEEEYNRVSLINKNKVYYSFNNRLPIERIKIGSLLKREKGSANLCIKERIEGMEIYYNEGYSFPLNIQFENNIVNLSLANKYYLDLIKGLAYEEYKENLIYTNQIIFPYIDNEYDITIELSEVFLSFNKVVLDFKLITKGNLLGNCNSSKYCLRRSYL